MIHAKQNFSDPFFKESFILAAWQIWKQRSNFIFHRGRPSLDSWNLKFKEEARFQAHRLCAIKKAIFLLFVDSLSAPLPFLGQLVSRVDCIFSFLVLYSSFVSVFLNLKFDSGGFPCCFLGSKTFYIRSEDKNVREMLHAICRPIPHKELGHKQILDGVLHTICLDCQKYCSNH